MNTQAVSILPTPARPARRTGCVHRRLIGSRRGESSYCTPGFITTITAYLEDNENPTPEEAREAISGNLCRCTGYQNIVAAVGRAAQLKRGDA